MSRYRELSRDRVDAAGSTCAREIDEPAGVLLARLDRRAGRREGLKLRGNDDDAETMRCVSA